MHEEIINSFLFRLLVSPDRSLRLIRHGLLWTTALLFIFEGFYFLSSSIADTSLQSGLRYSLAATAVFGGLTVSTYWIITTLAHQFILVEFRPYRFVIGLLIVHILASELVLVHFWLFIRFLTLPRLPHFYSTYLDHIAHLSFWQAPVDVIIVVFFSFSFFYNYLLYTIGFKVFKDLFTVQLQQIDLKRENLRLELEFLKAQINPHFLFNTLNNIYSFSVQAPEKVEASLLKLADLMRYTLYETSDERVLLRNEIIFITSYLDLQRIRHDEHVSIQFIVHGEPATQCIPPLLLITFIENAFKHGVQASAQTSWITIQLNLLANKLILQIDNSVPSVKQKTPSGIGLVNVRKRLEYFFPQQHQLIIKAEPNLYSVLLTLDLDESHLPSNYTR